MASNVTDANGTTGPKVMTRLIDDAEVPATAVVSAVASVRDESIERIECLYDTIDPDALNTLVGEKSDAELSIRFEYGGCTVQVTQDRVQVIDASSV